MSTLTQAEILALANQIAEEDDDMNEAQVGGGGDFNKRFTPGWSVARLTSYIEKGKHVELYQGKAKDPALMFSLGFELYSPNYLNDDGTPYFMETWDISKSRNEKARAFKLFKEMNFKGIYKNFAQFLGQEIFLVEIKDHVSKNAAPGTPPKSVIGQVRAGIEPVSGQPYACPEATKLFLFSWARPTLDGWDSFFIEGTNEKTGKSKNWKQEFIAGAVDFKGSALEGLLLQNGRPIPVGTPQKTGATSPGAPPAGAQPAGAAPAGVAAPTQPVVPASAPVAPAAPAGVVPNVAAVPAPVSVAPVVAPVATSVAAVVATPVAPVAAVAAPSPAVAALAVAVPVAPVVPAVAPAVANAPVVPAPLAQ